MAIAFRKIFIYCGIAGAVIGTLFSLNVQAQLWSSHPQANSEQDAKARYEADKRLCADEASSEARLQCRRDAQSVYDRALSTQKPSNAYTSKSAQVGCMQCGRVTAVTVAEKKGESNAMGMIAGGVAGAVIGHQVGGGFGKDLATVAGAAGGAYAGRRIQENMNARNVWTVSVQYPDGRTGSYHFNHDPGFTAGTEVRMSGNSVVRN